MDQRLVFLPVYMALLHGGLPSPPSHVKNAGVFHGSIRVKQNSEQWSVSTGMLARADGLSVLLTAQVPCVLRDNIRLGAS